MHAQQQSSVVTQQLVGAEQVRHSTCIPMLPYTLHCISVSTAAACTASLPATTAAGSTLASRAHRFSCSPVKRLGSLKAAGCGEHSTTSLSTTCGNKVHACP